MWLQSAPRVTSLERYVVSGFHQAKTADVSLQWGFQYERWLLRSSPTLGSSLYFVLCHGVAFFLSFFFPVRPCTLLVTIWLYSTTISWADAGNRLWHELPSVPPQTRPVSLKALQVGQILQDFYVVSANRSPTPTFTSSYWIHLCALQI